MSIWPDTKDLRTHPTLRLQKSFETGSPTSSTSVNDPNNGKSFKNKLSCSSRTALYNETPSYELSELLIPPHSSRKRKKELVSRLHRRDVGGKEAAQDADHDASLFQTTQHSAAGSTHKLPQLGSDLREVRGDRVATGSCATG